jgi:hypothetical protein
MGLREEINKRLHKCPICGSTNGFKVKGLVNISAVCKSCSAEWTVDTTWTGKAKNMELKSLGSDWKGHTLWEQKHPIEWWARVDLSGEEKVLASAYAIYHGGHTALASHGPTSFFGVGGILLATEKSIKFAVAKTLQELGLVDTEGFEIPYDKIRVGQIKQAERITIPFVDTDGTPQSPVFSIEPHPFEGLKFTKGSVLKVLHNKIRKGKW